MICADGGRAPDRRALELDDARRDAERRLHVVVVCLDTLQRVDISPGERKRETEVFLSTRTDAVKVLAEIRRLIVEWSPTVPDAELTG